MQVSDSPLLVLTQHDKSTAPEFSRRCAQSAQVERNDCSIVMDLDVYVFGFELEVRRA